MIACRIVIGRGKRELVLGAPLLAAAGALGYDPTAATVEGLERLGAYVTPALTPAPRRGAESSRLARTTAGYVLHTGRRNPGVSRAVRRHARAWGRCGLPVIAALYAASPDEAAAGVERLVACDCIQAIEIHLAHDADAEDAFAVVRAAQSGTALPCLLRVTERAALAQAIAAEEAGADAVVVAAPPHGRTPAADGGWVAGPLHSPALAPLYAALVHEVHGATDLPIIGRGGVATADDVLALLAAGAVAVQLDSILYVDPGAPVTISESLEARLAEAGAADWEAFLATLQGTPEDGA